MGALYLPAQLEERIPKLEKFCFCMDTKAGVKVGAIVLVIWYVLILLGALTGGSGTGNSVISVILCLINLAAFALVLYGQHKGESKFLIPAIYLCLADVVIGIIWGIVLFIFLAWFAAIFCAASAFLTGYYFVALKNEFDSMGGEPAAPPAEPKPVNPV